MATDAKPEPDLLRFLKDRYLLLKTQAETDNIPGSSNANIKAIIVRIDELYTTITTTGDINHEKIVEQLKAIRTPYNDLKLEGSYTRYTEATDRLNLIVDGLEKVGGEELAPGAGPEGPEGA
jgi:hypothetical protein